MKILCRFSALTILSISLALLLMSPSSFGDTLELRDGSLIEGVYMGGTQNSVRFEDEESVKTYSVADVLAVTFQTLQIEPITEEQPPSPAETPPSVEVSVGPMVAAGTRLLIRTRETLDSRKHRVGHMFTAILEGDLVADGQTVAPRGGTVYGRLAEAKKSGRLAGRSELTLQITDIMIDNRPHSVMTSSVKAVSDSTAKKTVGTTARAAAIGGLIDGSKGAKTGAKVGAGVSILTSGNQVYIPGGTLLEFQLAAPLTVTP
jgi:hypothetical protein